jgi:hypothetical protein
MKPDLEDDRVLSLMGRRSGKKMGNKSWERERGTLKCRGGSF